MQDRTGAPPPPPPPPRHRTSVEAPGRPRGRRLREGPATEVPVDPPPPRESRSGGRGIRGDGRPPRTRPPRYLPASTAAPRGPHFPDGDGRVRRGSALRKTPPDAAPPGSGWSPHRGHGAVHIDGGGPHVDQRLDGDQEPRQRHREVQRGEDDDGGKVAPPPTPAIPKEPRVTTSTRVARNWKPVGSIPTLGRSSPPASP